MHNFNVIKAQSTTLTRRKLITYPKCCSLWQLGHKVIVFSTESSPPLDKNILRCTSKYGLPSLFLLNGAVSPHNSQISPCSGQVKLATVL